MVRRFLYSSDSKKLASTYGPVLNYYDGNVSLNGNGVGYTWSNLSAYSQIQPWEQAGIPWTNTIWTPHTMMRSDTVGTLFIDEWSHQTRTRHDRWGQVLDVKENNSWQRYDAGWGWVSGGDTIFYHRSGMVLDSIVHPMKTVERFAYQMFGDRPLLTVAIKPGGDTVLYEYDDVGQVSRISGSKTTTQQIYRSASTQLTDSVVVAGVLSTRFKYDALGRDSVVTDDSSHVTTYAYDAVSGNLARVTRPGARVDSMHYDGYGRDSVSRSHGGVARFRRYDILNRLTRDSIGGEPRATEFYAPSTEKEFFTHLKDAQGQVHKTTVNAAGWAVRVYDVADTTKFDSLLYNMDGQLSGKINRRGQRINYLYDNLHRFKKQHGPNMGTDSIHFDYLWTNDSPRRRQKQIIYSGSSAVADSMVVDSLGWLQTHVTKFRVGSNSSTDTRFVRNYTRNSLLLPEETKFKIYRYGAADTTNGAITFCTRQLGWTSSTRSLLNLQLCGLTPAISVGRNSEYVVDSLAFPTASHKRYFTSRHERSRSDFSHSALTGLGQGYAYGDSLDRVTELSWYSGSQSEIRRMQYDTKGQLTKWRWGTNAGTCPSGPPADENGNTCASFTATQLFTYSYDSAGNLKQIADSAAATTTTGTHAGNRLTAWGGTNYTYDLDGNMVTRRVGTDSTMFTWSPDNRLLKVKRGSDSTEYDYNAEGQMIRRKKQGKIERHFLWDGDQLVVELDSAATSRVAEYAYWLGIDQPVALVTGNTSIAKVRYYDQDVTGNVSGLWDPTSGTPVLVQNLQYEPFGALEASSVTGTLGDTSRVLWKGLAWEGGNTNLYFMRNRWYDPEMRRFVGEDPIGVEGGVNVYVFGGNDPVNFSDPMGLSPECRKWEALEEGWRCTGGWILDPIEVLSDRSSGVSGIAGDRGGRPWATGSVGAGGASAQGRRAPYYDPAGGMCILYRQDQSPLCFGVPALSSGKLSKVLASTTREAIFGRWIKTVKILPGKGPGQSHAQIVTYKNMSGNVIRTFKDSFDRAGRWMHRKPLRGGPEGRQP